MKYVPRLTGKEISENYKISQERLKTYNDKGLDFFKNREFILDKTGELQGSVLEIGSGRGVTALSLAKAGYNFTTLDNDEEMLKTTALNLAHENLLDKADLLLMDGNSLDLQDTVFNNIFMVEVLHHIQDIDNIFNEADRVLCEKGLFVLADFNDKGRKIIEDVHAGEGRSHESSSIGKNESKNWLSEKGYMCREYDDNCHWIVIAEKIMKDE